VACDLSESILQPFVERDRLGLGMHLQLSVNVLDVESMVLMLIPSCVAAGRPSKERDRYSERRQPTRHVHFPPIDWRRIRRSVMEKRIPESRAIRATCWMEYRPRCLCVVPLYVQEPYPCAGTAPVPRLLAGPAAVIFLPRHVALARRQTLMLVLLPMQAGRSARPRNRRNDL
jgi:hypothetical protein